MAPPPRLGLYNLDFGSIFFEKKPNVDSIDSSSPISSSMILLITNLVCLCERYAIASKKKTSDSSSLLKILIVSS